MKRTTGMLLAVAAAAGGAVSVASAQQNTLTTLFSGGTQGTTGGGLFFDVTVGNTAIEVTGFNTNTNTVAGTSFGFRVFTKTGTYVGNHTNQPAWTLQTAGTAVSAGGNNPSVVTLDNSFQLQPNTTYGMFLVYGNGGPTAVPVYTNTPNINYSNQDLAIAAGSAQATPFVSGLNTPRVWNGTIKYTVLGTTGACCFFNGSCVVTSQTNCTSGGGTYHGDGTTCATVNCPQPPTGACCFPDACLIKTQAQCLAASGVYAGDNVTCAAANCTPPGACCLSDGSCIILPQSKCSSGTVNGTYRGNGTTCATANCWTAPVLWNNGRFVTHPAGAVGGADGSVVPTGANTLGENMNLGALVRVADNFTIPAGETWTINRLKVFVYQTGATTSPTTITDLVAQIWDRDPRDPNAVLVWGDLVTNIHDLANSGWSNVYRGALTAVDRPVMRTEGIITAPPLGAGTYWIEWSTRGSLASGPFGPPVTLLNDLPTGNALIWRNAPYTPVVDSTWNLLEYPGGQPIELPFILEGIKGTANACYANCDGSTVAPILNVSDFICFQTKYAAGDSYANCDNSTIPPVLNVSDFICFQTKYSAGCS